MFLRIHSFHVITKKVFNVILEVKLLYHLIVDSGRCARLQYQLPKHFSFPSDGRWFSLDVPASFTNKIDHREMAQ